MAAVSTYQSPSHFIAKNEAMEFAEGIPDQLDSPLAWTKAEAESLSSHWFVKLEQSEIAQVDKALADFEGESLGLVPVLYLVTNFMKHTTKIYPRSPGRLSKFHRHWLGVSNRSHINVTKVSASPSFEA